MEKCDDTERSEVEVIARNAVTKQSLQGGQNNGKM